MAIDRDNIKNAIKTIDSAVTLLKNDEVNVAVYPEGTRTHDGKLQKMHDVMFKIAIKAEVPIVVITIQGAENVRKRFIRKRTDVYIKVEDVIDKEFVKNSRSNVIGERVRTDMLQTIE